MGAEMRSLNITVNGRTRRVDVGDPATVARVIDALGLEGKRIAVECNGSIVSRSRYGDTLLEEGDRLEIVGAVGGG
jgi:sulfur carrier protein